MYSFYLKLITTHLSDYFNVLTFEWMLLACRVQRKSLFYQRLRIYNDDGSEERLLVKCTPSPDLSTTHNIVRRDLPPDFVEPESVLGYLAMYFDLEYIVQHLILV